MTETPSSMTNTTAVRVIPLHDFFMASEVFSNWQGRLEQISSGRFEGTLKIVRGGLIRIIGINANQRVLVRGRDAAGLFSVYPVTTENCGSLWQGYRLTPGQLVLHGMASETDHYSARRIENLGLSLDPTSLVEAARTLLSQDRVDLPQNWAIHSPPPKDFASLNRRLTHLLNLGVADPTLLGTPEGKQHEQECVSMLVAALFSKSAPQPKLSLPKRSQLIRRADEFMRSHLSDPVGAIDLCQELGTSDRTVRLAFRERFGLGPMTYYKRLRLNAVRSVLVASSLSTVRDAARMFGFHHMGNFAADYRSLFGEGPSSTPRQNKDSMSNQDDHSSPV